MFLQLALPCSWIEMLVLRVIVVVVVVVLLRLLQIWTGQFFLAVLLLLLFLGFCTNLRHVIRGPFLLLHPILR